MVKRIINFFKWLCDDGKHEAELVREAIHGYHAISQGECCSLKNANGPIVVREPN